MEETTGISCPQEDKDLIPLSLKTGMVRAKIDGPQTPA